MRIAAFADIHGNAWALERVLADMQQEKPDMLLFLGDALIRVPAPQETMSLLTATPHQAVRGNYDWFVVGNFPGEQKRLAKEPFLLDELVWTRNQLSHEQKDYLAALPLSLRLFSGTAQELMVCHCSPGGMSRGLFPPPETHHWGMTDAECLALLGTEQAPTVLCGHTHAVLDRRVDRYRIINPGAVSLGWNMHDEIDGYARWSLLTWQNGAWQVEFRTSVYDHRPVWQCYRAWQLWPYMQQFDKPQWWGELVQSFAKKVG